MLAFLLTAAALSGCGLKDDLYLPPPEQGSEREAEQPSSETQHGTNAGT